MMKKANNSIFLNDLPRILHGEFRLYRMLDLNEADGPWRGIRPDEFEIAIRLACADPSGKDLQDGVFSSMSFPHVYIKKPRSCYYSGDFATRKAFILIYRGSDEQKFYRLGLSPENNGWEIQLTDEIAELIRKLKEASALLHLEGTADRMDMLAEQLFRELLLQSKQPASVDPYELRIRQAASWLTRHYMEQVDLDTLFARYGFSRRSFYRHWGNVFRNTPKDFLRNLRLQEAERLLVFNTFSVADIAWQLQFHDVSHFIRLFRKKNGLTPLQFRKKNGSGNI